VPIGMRLIGRQPLSNVGPSRSAEIAAVLMAPVTLVLRCATLNSCHGGSRARTRRLPEWAMWSTVLARSSRLVSPSESQLGVKLRN